ncbi:MAG TPA: pyridoxamine 5'-phosphate oxidase [Candidatus Limnocylindrales bacterium]|jgi:pyridoxamine 5'-phosphate oxidase
MPLLESDLDADPIAQLERWLADAAAVGVTEPGAMTLATATPDGRPSARMVLLRGLDADGLRFYSNHGSQKGRELAANPRAAVVLHWEQLGRQVRVTGSVMRLDEAASTAYFASRPHGSRLAAWSSEQSATAPDRAAIDARFAAVAARFPDEDVPLPPFWGGYRVVPETLEFWQHGADRLHDRLRYRRPAATEAANAAGWLVERLQP